MKPSKFVLLSIKSFFSKLLDENFTNQIANNVARGFIDLYSTREIQVNQDKIDKILTRVPHQSSIMLKISLASKSKKLEKAYIKSIISELREANSSDLDSFLFGPLAMAYKKSGKDTLNPQARQEVIEYLKFVAHKYTAQGLFTNKNDGLAVFTAPSYFELVSAIEM